MNRGLILFLLALALIGAAVAATALPGPALCLPPGCDLPISISWPFGPAGLSGLRILSVFVVFLLTAILVAVVLGSRRRRRTLLIGIPVAIVLSWVVVDGASPIGQWFAADGTPLSSEGHPLVLSVERGSGHCGWKGVGFLSLAWPLDRPVPGAFMSNPRTKVYVRQTTSAYPVTSLATTPAIVASMPKDARDTGLHRGSWKLWVSPSQLTRAVFLSSGDTIERWSFVSKFVGCA